MTLTWTTPTDAKFTGFEVRRINRVDDEAQGAQPPAQDRLTTLYTSNNDSRTRYEDRTVVEGYEYTYIVTPIERLAQPIQNTGGTTEQYRAHTSGRTNTGEAPLRPTSTPDDPRNVRFTRESQNSRRLAWETPAARHLTIEKIYRGETSRPVNDRWLTGYQVERHEYLLYEAARSDDFTAILPESVEETLLSATMTVGTSTVGTSATGYFGLGNNAFGAMTQSTFTHPSGTWEVTGLTISSMGAGLYLTIREIPIPHENVPTDVFEDWVLMVDGAWFPFEVDEGIVGVDLTITWQNHGLNWTDGQEISVQLVERQILEWETLRAGDDSNISTTFTDSENTQGLRYVYRVQAVNALGSSDTNDNSNWAWMDLPPIGGL